MNAEDVLAKVKALAEEAAVVADEIRPIEEVPGDVWAGANGVAKDLEELERDLRSDIIAAGQSVRRTN